jgi:hypothetical protein
MEQSEEFIDTGSELVLRKNVVLIEPFNPEDNPKIKPKTARNSRVALFDRSFLAPKSPEDFVTEYGFVLIENDRVAVNSDHIVTDANRKGEVLRVKRYEQKGSVPPKKNFKTDLHWDGGYTSLVTEPQVVFAILHPKKAEPALEAEASSSNRPPPRRRAARASRDEPTPKGQKPSLKPRPGESWPPQLVCERANTTIVATA